MNSDPSGDKWRLADRFHHSYDFRTAASRTHALPVVATTVNSLVGGGLQQIPRLPAARGDSNIPTPTPMPMLAVSTIRSRCVRFIWYLL